MFRAIKVGAHGIRDSPDLGRTHFIRTTFADAPFFAIQQVRLTLSNRVISASRTGEGRFDFVGIISLDRHVSGLSPENMFRSDVYHTDWLDCCLPIRRR